MCNSTLANALLSWKRNPTSAVDNPFRMDKQYKVTFIIDEVRRMRRNRTYGKRHIGEILFLAQKFIGHFVKLAIFIERNANLFKLLY